MKIRFKNVVLSLFGISLLSPLSGCKKENKFVPKLSTDKRVILNTLGFFGNFEALDNVINSFNEYYPNVEFEYQSVNQNNILSFIDSNSNTDLMMSSAELLFKQEFTDRCLDLNDADINLNDFEDEMISSSMIDGKLLSLPIGKNVFGLVTNVSLLKKCGLNVPSNLSEFRSCLSVLKEKGYTPIQGPNSKIYFELTFNMFADLIIDDDVLYSDLITNKAIAKEKIEPVFDLLEEFIDKGYINAEVNKQFPDDNYDKAILKFFEGDVPFWVCNSEKVSGMQKRESKSEAFSSNPFEYDYIFAPIGEKGSYVYSEPWYGFAINKDGANVEYAKEFLRFYSTKDQLNNMSKTKGIPSPAKVKDEKEIYKSMSGIKTIEKKCHSSDRVSIQDNASYASAIRRFGLKEITKTEAIDFMLSEYYVHHHQ